MSLLLLVSSLLGAAECYSGSANQVSELWPAQFVLLHEPGIEVQLAGFHPYGALFEPFGASRQSAREAHQRFRAALEKYGVQTKTVREILRTAPQRKLVDLAMTMMNYTFQGSTADIPERVLYYASDAYKRGVLERLPSDEVIDVILSRPSIGLLASSINTAVLANLNAVSPVGNLVFTRDQQITTAKGVVMGRLNSVQRQAEPTITELCWNLLGVPVIGHVADVPGARLEGGDFIPLGPEICYIGIGLRTNMLGVQYLLDRDLFGTQKVAVVKDIFDFSQDRMHLDTVFNVVDEHTVVMLQDIIGAESPLRRLVDVYVKGPDGVYRLDPSATDVEFSRFITQQGFRIISTTNEQQLQYMINFLNLGAGNILSVHPDLGDVLSAAGYGGNVEYVNYTGITQMYGAAHCTSQVLRLPTPPSSPVPPPAPSPGLTSFKSFGTTVSALTVGVTPKNYAINIVPTSKLAAGDSIQISANVAVFQRKVKA